MNTLFESEYDQYLTPPEIVKALGEFDLDPCSPIIRPWPTAKHHYTILEDGLKQEWFGRVWMNPPFSDSMTWLNMFIFHGNGIGLIKSETETRLFQHAAKNCWSIFMFSKRIPFLNVLGEKSGIGRPRSGHCLISFGKKNVEAIGDSKLEGTHFLTPNYMPVIVVGVSPRWKTIVTCALTRVGGEADLKTIYEVVETIAPDRIQKNVHYKAKVRQILQHYFTRISEGKYAN